MNTNMEISDGRLYINGEPCRFDDPHPRNFSRTRMEPDLLVYHDTAGRLKEFSSVNWFNNPAARASSQFVVETDGTITQMVLCDQIAFHAGKSSWQGRRSCNRFAIGN